MASLRNIKSINFKWTWGSWPRVWIERRPDMVTFEAELMASLDEQGSYTIEVTGADANLHRIMFPRVALRGVESGRGVSAYLDTTSPGPDPLRAAQGQQDRLPHWACTASCCNEDVDDDGRTRDNPHFGHGHSPSWDDLDDCAEDEPTEDTSAEAKHRAMYQTEMDPDKVRDTWGRNRTQAHFGCAHGPSFDVDGWFYYTRRSEVVDRRF